MSIHDTYSKRNKEQSDVFVYDLNDKIKVQVVHIWTNYFHQLSDDLRAEIWQKLHSAICEEFGKKTLLSDDLRRFYDSYRVESYFEKTATLEECLDIIEFVFKYISKIAEYYQARYYTHLNLQYPGEKAISDLNTRFLENNIGYEFQQNKIIRIDNNLLHQEIMIPVFNFITSQTFKNVNDEFLSAHVHYRHTRNKECLADCSKALETTMKIICSENGWPYKQQDTSKTLIDICFAHKLIPDYLQTQFSSLRAIIESGIPTLRNKLGGHGQGTQKIIVPDHFVSYMLFMTATTIKFLISCQKEIKPFT